MTSPHLTAQELRSYLEKDLSPSDLIRLGDHVAGCEECRQRLSTDQREPPARQVGRALLGARPGVEHPDEDELGDHVDGALDPERAARLARHLDECAACAADVRELQSLRAGWEGTAAPVRAAVPGTPRLAIAAGLAAVLAAGVWLVHRAPSGTEGPPARAGADLPGSPRMSLNDLSGAIVQTAGGRWSGWPTQTAVLDDEVRRALASQTLPVPADVLELHGTPANMRSSSPASPSFLVGPVGVVVEDDRPALRWRSVPGARRYVVTVSDEEG